MAQHTAGIDGAVANNATWCDAVCRTHGITGSFAADAWTAPVRTPPLYPDAVVLHPDADARSVLDRIDAGPGASVKDSFATLDLTPYGFEVLLDATWITLAPGAGSLLGDTLELAAVHRDEFAAWEHAWRGDDGPADVLRAELLENPAVTLLVDPTSTAAGAALYATDGVVGVSNVFAGDGAVDAAWRGIVAWTAMHRPGAALVGYESGADLAAAWPLGFDPVAPLRVWMHR